MYIKAVRKLLILAVALALGCNRSQPSPATPQAAPHRPDLSVKIQVPRSVQLQVVPPGQMQVEPTAGQAQASPTGQSSAAPSAQVQSASPAEAGDQGPPRVTKHDADTPLLLAGQTFHFVAHLAQIEHPGPLRGIDDITVESWELRDPGGAVVYRNTETPVTPPISGGGFDFSESVDASVLNGKRGSVVLVEGDSEPSAPDGGGSMQLFGFHNGKLKPFLPSVSAYELVGLGTDPMRGGADILKFSVRAGNFNVIYPVVINWDDGTLRPARICLRPSSGRQVERCPYEVKADHKDVEEQTFVRLYYDAEEQGVPKHLVVDPGSRIDFLAAEAHVNWKGNAKDVYLEVQADDLWLKIRVDGKEGWIHSEEDFEAVGLPFYD